MGLTAREWLKRRERRKRGLSVRLANVHKRKKQREKERKSLEEKSQVWKIDSSLHYANYENSSFRNETVKSFEALREKSKKSNKLIVDLRKLESISPEGMLLLYANLWELKHGEKKTIFYKLPKNNKVLQVLSQIEFDTHIANKKIVVDLNRDDVIHWKFSTEKSVKMEEYKKLVEGYVKDISVNSDNKYNGKFFVYSTYRVYD